MAEWRVGRKLGRTLYRDEVFMGILDSPEVAAEIVEAMNGLNYSRGQWVESGRERSPEPQSASAPGTVSLDDLGPFDEPPGGTCQACGCNWRWHQHGRCAGDFMCCTCTETPPDEAP